MMNSTRYKLPSIIKVIKCVLACSWNGGGKSFGDDMSRRG